MDNEKRPYKFIGDRINTLLAETDGTQKELAELLDVKPNIISYYCGGYRQPSIQQLIVIAEHYKVSVDWLLGRTKVKSVDKDFAFVCEYTGLSEEVISTIVTLKQPHIAWVETLNALLENEKFISLIYIISDKLNIQEEQFERAGMHSFLSNIDMIDYKISTEIKAATDEIRATIPGEKTQAGKLRSWWERAMKPRNNK